MPDYGKILTYRSPAASASGSTAASAYGGAVITPFYDSLLVKVTAWGQTFRDRAAAHGPRAARVPHPRRQDEHSVPRKRHRTSDSFSTGQATTRLIDTTPELFQFTPRRDRATKLLTYLGDVIVNGNPQVKGTARDSRSQPRPCPTYDRKTPPPPGTRQLLLELGAEEIRRVDAQAEAAADHRHDVPRCASVAAGHARAHATTCWRSPTPSRAARRELFSLEMWGGATFDTAMRFLHEDPWERLRAAARAHAEHLFPDAAARRRTPSATRTIRTMSCAGFVEARRRSGHGHLPHLRFAELTCRT